MFQTPFIYKVLGELITSGEAGGITALYLSFVTLSTPSLHRSGHEVAEKLPDAFASLLTLCRICSKVPFLLE
jgi:hypothetical protein